MSTAQIPPLPRAPTRPRKHCDRCGRIVLHGGATIYHLCATCEGMTPTNIMQDVAYECAARAHVRGNHDKHDDFCAMCASANESWKRLLREPA